MGTNYTTDKAMTGADALINILCENGIEYLFTSPIAALAPLWEGFAKRAGKKTAFNCHDDHPRYVNCRHELLAVGLAIGYYKSSGKMAAVCLPTGLGVQNASMALRMARQEKVPILVLSPDTLCFGEDPTRDPGPEWPTFLIDDYGPARNGEKVTKWTIACRMDGDLYPNINRALFFAQQIPRGPCLVEVPFETLMSPFDNIVNRFPRSIAAGVVQASEEHVLHIASILSEAKNPIIITEHFGCNEEAVATLTRFAELLAAPVFEWWLPCYENIDRSHPLHGGGAVEEILCDADVIIIACANGPWHGPHQTLRENAKVIVLEQDPLRPTSAYCGYNTTHCISGDPLINLARICDKINVNDNDNTISRRLSRWTDHNAKKKDEFHQQNLKERGKVINEGTKTIFAMDFFEALSELMPPGSIVVDEIVSQVPHYLHYLFKKEPEKNFKHLRGWQGGLGTGLSVALGAKVANPGKIVVCIIGDGAFSYNPIPAVLGFSQQYDAPIIICVMNNSGYSSQRWNMYKYFHDGVALKTQNTYGDLIEPEPKYHKLVEAWDGLGMKIDTLDELGLAFETAVKSERLCLLNVSVRP